MEEKTSVAVRYVAVALGSAVVASALSFALAAKDAPPVPAVAPIASSPPAASVASASASARPLASAAPVSAASAFTHIYDSARWGTNDAGVGKSGYGSSLEATAVYRVYLQSFMKKNGIKSVVDVGCGDWEFSQAIDWSGIDYKGYDVVASVIARDKAAFEKPNIHFFVADAVNDELPEADLLLVKHVLQHLPNEAAVKLMGKLNRYKHILLTNTVMPETLSAPNVDIPMGGFRPFDPTAPPYNLPGLKVLSWWTGKYMEQVVYLKSAQ